jgi:hypothetical protein
MRERERWGAADQNGSFLVVLSSDARRRLTPAPPFRCALLLLRNYHNTNPF